MKIGDVVAEMVQGGWDQTAYDLRCGRLHRGGRRTWRKYLIRPKRFELLEALRVRVLID
jgi:hypothetical protein